jgi:hypothetical protein
MKCCIPTCERSTIRESYAFCPPCYQEYGKPNGKRSQYPEWLKMLINSNKREHYAEQRNSRYERSLEELLENGRLDPDRIVPYTGPPRKGRKKNAKSDGASYSTRVD